MSGYATYHKDVPMHKDALKVEGVIQSPTLVSKKDYHILAKCVDENTTGVSPMIIGIDSNEYYNFYYLNNGDRVDISRYK